MVAVELAVMAPRWVMCIRRIASRMMFVRSLRMPRGVLRKFLPFSSPLLAVEMSVLYDVHVDVDFDVLICLGIRIAARRLRLRLTIPCWVD
jgi:hypothetical protein